ncbi:hypothetical protein HUN92_21630 [Bacillus firmus]|uniref:hypothetical protein n=1 Tax=Cytobacillus firmus TaxID=1399 RepID=UPI0015802864|nr:hypothetical protein [Cytobacillus firmus]NUH86250.1 hypothetical protein [Cytobacillus firmus]
MITEAIFKERIVGAINTCIRMINESDKWDLEGKGIIENEWHSYQIKNDHTFVAVLTILGQKQTILFKKEEWIGFDVNVAANVKLQELLTKYSY